MEVAWALGIVGTLITALVTAIGVMWADNRKLRRQLDALHLEHKDDIKELTRASLELGLSVVARARPRLGSGTSQPPSGGTE